VESFPRVLGQAKAIAAGVVLYKVPEPPKSIYAAPSNSCGIVTSLVICNKSGSIRNLYVHVLQDGEATSTANLVMSGYPVPANTTRVVDCGFTLGPKESINVVDFTGNLLVSAFGIEVQ
jgi:hypothetical protein